MVSLSSTGAGARSATPRAETVSRRAREIAGRTEGFSRESYGAIASLRPGGLVVESWMLPAPRNPKPGGIPCPSQNSFPWTPSCVISFS